MNPRRTPTYGAATRLARIVHGLLTRPYGWRFTEGTFGIIGGPQTYAELLILTPETTAYLSSRRLHPTQQFRQRRDGKTVLSMTVHGTAELTNWIVSLGPYVRVLRPRRLRDEVADLLRSAAALYDGE